MYGEFDLIARIEALFGHATHAHVGIGDDCAVLACAGLELVSTDTYVEGVHFRRDWSSAGDIGWKCLAASLSDIAAMGGTPRVFFLNLTLGPQDSPAFVDALLQGMREARDATMQGLGELTLAGGDTTATPGPSVITVTVMGVSPSGGPLLRRGARPGDRIALLGHTGLAAAAVDILSGGYAEALPAGDPLPDWTAPLLEAHRRPHALVRAARDIAEAGLVHAMLDVSDGLAQDLGHLLRQSRAGARVHLPKVPVHPALIRLAAHTGAELTPWTLAGGDDYALVMAVPPASMAELAEIARHHGLALGELGEVVEESRGLELVDENGQLVHLARRGYEHFS